MQQSGFLYKLRETDYVLGTNSPLQGVDLLPNGDWIGYRPDDEAQYDFNFDTFCCSTFSATSDLEALFNFYWDKGYFSSKQMEWLRDNKYYWNGKFNFSDRFSAISNGTMPNGQYIQVVWDDFRHNGLIPEKDLPFGGKNQAEYLDKSKITPAMREKAQKFLEMIIEKDANGKYMINYEWVPVETGNELNAALKQAPIQVAVTKEYPSHAIVLLRMDTEFETYPPYLRARNRTVAYALKPIVKIKKEVPNKWRYFKPEEKTGGMGTVADLKTELVDLLDEARHLAGIPFVLMSGYRTKEYNKQVGGVPDSAHITREGVDIRCRNSEERYKIKKALYAVGFRRVGDGTKKGFVHADISKTLPQDVEWDY